MTTMTRNTFSFRRILPPVLVLGMAAVVTAAVVDAPRGKSLRAYGAEIMLRVPSDKIVGEEVAILTDAPNVPGHRPPPLGGDKGERGGRSNQAEDAEQDRRLGQLPGQPDRPGLFHPAAQVGRKEARPVQGEVPVAEWGEATRQDDARALVARFGPGVFHARASLPLQREG